MFWAVLVCGGLMCLGLWMIYVSMRGLFKGSGQFEDGEFSEHGQFEMGMLPKFGMDRWSEFEMSWFPYYALSDEFKPWDLNDPRYLVEGKHIVWGVRVYGFVADTSDECLRFGELSPFRSSFEEQSGLSGCWGGSAVGSPNGCGAGSDTPS